ncbi:hypothetical protein [Moraxella marmotae]|uniref:hypothetical protein n=1 Tax=Moraxella marmotae TaxID=3344520 RepID=UPI0035F374BD
MKEQEKLSFVQLAVLAMKMADEPMTAAELWEFVLQNNLHHRLNSYNAQTQSFIGKTPKVTFAAKIGRHKDIFTAIPNTKPKQYILKNLNHNAIIDLPSEPTAAELLIDKNTMTPKKVGYHERELHPVLSHFLKHNEYFRAYSKTIFHEESFKGVRGEDKWLYPDMVAVNFKYANYQKNNVLNFIKKFDKPPIAIFSFEIKKELNFSNYKESFFQAVSNSSWANEGYLVAVEIKRDNQFIEALQKLSQSFGIGIVELNLQNIHQSKILSPAKFKENLDYSVLDELANKNPNFAQFLKTITDFDVDNPNRFKGEFDKILSVDELHHHLKIRLCIEHN